MKIKVTLSLGIVCVALLATTAPVLAHHNLIAQFATEKQVTVRGTVTKVEWMNPHGWIHLDVKGPDGQVKNWAVETGSPLRMKKRGLSPTDFKVGADVIFGGFPAKDGALSMAGWIVTFPDRETATPPREASFSLGR